MKGRIVLIINLFLIILFSIPTGAQILNGGFEAWTNGINPDYWSSNNAFVYSVITESTDKYIGNYAVKGEVVNYDSSSIPPLFFGGAKGEGFSVNKRYDSFEGYYKFVSIGGDFFNAIIIMYKDNKPIASTNTSLTPSPDYSNFKIPIHYLTSEIPDRFSIKFLIADTSGLIPAHIGSYFLLDEVQLTGDAATDVSNIDSNIPSKFHVYQNYPNPFNPTTTIKYSIPEANDIIINIYDINGTLINTLLNKKQSAGTYEVTWNGKNNSHISVSSGIYLYRITSGNYSKSFKMILLK